MQYRSIKGFTGAAQLGFLLIFLGGGFFLAGVVQIVIGLQVIPSGLPLNKMIDEMMKAMIKPENVSYARLFQVLGTFFLLCAPAVLYLIVCHGKNIFWLGFNKHINFRQIILGFFLIFLANIIAGPLFDLSKMILSNFPDLNAKAQIKFYFL